VRIVKAEQLPLAGNARLLRMGRHDGARTVVVGKASAGKAGIGGKRAARR
jgi:Fe2+ transport system protein FeoA